MSESVPAWFKCFCHCNKVVLNLILGNTYTFFCFFYKKVCLY